MMLPMALRRTVANLALKALRGVMAGGMRHPNQNQWGYLLPGTNIDYADKLGKGFDSNVLMAPILYVCRTFTEARLAVQTESNGKTVLNAQHALPALLRAPNLSYSGAQLWFATLLSWWLDGNAYWFKNRDGSGAVRELWYLPHWMVEPRWDRTERAFVDYYRYTTGGMMVELAPEDVVHLRYGMDPENVRLGYSPLKSVVREAYTDGEASNLVASILRNKGVPGIMFSPENGVDVDDPESLKSYFKDKFTGDRRGEPMVMTAPMKVQEFGFSPQELDLSSVHNLGEERVCALMGLPAAVVGFGTGLEQTKVGATMAEMRRLAWTDCIIPMQSAIAQDLTRALLPDFGGKPGQEVGFDHSGVAALEDNLDKQAERVERSVRGGYMMVSEAREVLGLPVDDSQKIFLRSIGIMEIAEDGTEVVRDVPEAEPQTGQPPPAAGADDQLPKGLKRMSRIQVRIVRAMQRLQKRHQKILYRRLVKFFGEMGEDFQRAWLAMGKAAPEDELRMYQLSADVDMDAYDRELTGIIQAHYVAIYKDTVSATASMGITIGDADERQNELLRLGGTNKIDLSQAGKDRALRIVADAREEGLSVDETARALRDHIPAGPWTSSAVRAEVVSRTETRFAQTRSALVVYRGAEGIDQVMMLDARLGPTDEECEEMAGRIVSFDEAQQLLDDEHPNGTRDIAPVFGD